MRRPRFKSGFKFSACVLGACMITSAASAGIPRGAIVMADEQDADPATGVTSARGNAEIRIETHHIEGRADAIEINPARNEIRFTGNAHVTVRSERYDNDRVTCTLDFTACRLSVDEIPPTAASDERGAAAGNTSASVTQPPEAQTLPPPSALGAAAITP